MAVESCLAKLESSRVELSGLEPGCQDRARVYRDMTTAWSQDVKGPRCQGVKEARCQEMIATAGQEHRCFLDGRFAGAYGNIY